MINVITSIGTSLISSFKEKKKGYEDILEDMKEKTFDEKYLDNNKRQINNLIADLISLLREDKDYSKILSKEYEALKNSELIRIPIQKEI